LVAERICDLEVTLGVLECVEWAGTDLTSF
jgi:hypothetical protein